MKWWPFRRSVSTETVNPALPPLTEAAPADMSRLLRVECDEVQALEQARSRLRMLGLAIAVGFGLLALRSIEMAIAHPGQQQ